MKIAVILPAAGMGTRFGRREGVTKTEMDLAGKPVFLWAVQRFVHRPQVGQVILAVNPRRLEQFQLRFADTLNALDVKIVAGGERERWETVLKAIDAVPPDCTHIAVHDAARPLTSDALIDRIFAAAQRYDAVLPGMAVTNTLKRVCRSDREPTEVHRIVETVDRSDLVGVQTPQIFEAGLLRRAYALLRTGQADGTGVTDDAALVQTLGESVYVVEGEATNFKITTPADADLAAAWLDAVMSREQRSRS